MHLRGTQEGEKTRSTLCLDTPALRYQSWRCTLRKSFNGPRFLHLLLFRKALKSLTWDICSLWPAVIIFCLTTCFYWASVVSQAVKNPWVRKIPWRRKWLPTPVLLPGKSRGQRSLMGYSPGSCKELDMMESAHTHMFFLAKNVHKYPGFSVFSLEQLLSAIWAFIPRPHPPSPTIKLSHSSACPWVSAKM